MASAPINYGIDSSSTVQRLNDKLGLETKSADASAAADINFNTFLKLLTTQLQYQDPLNPVENTEFTAQIAQFSGLEQQITTNELLEKMASSADFSQQSMAMSYIGKDALVPGKTTANDGQTDVGINYSLPYDAYDVVVEISDSDGNVVRTLEGEKAQGLNQTVWDGLNDAGEPVASGVYTFDVTATDVDGDDMTSGVVEYNYAQILSMQGTGDNIQFSTYDGRTVDMDDIVMVRERFEVTQDSNAVSAQSYLGKEVLAPDNLVGTDGSQNIELAYSLPKESVNTTVTVKDADGNIIRTMVGTNDAGLNKMTWDSKDDDGNPVDAGTYLFEVTAYDDAGTDLSENVHEYSYGRVVEVQGDGDSASFILADGRVVSRNSVISVRESSES